MAGWAMNRFGSMESAERRARRGYKTGTYHCPEGVTDGHPVISELADLQAIRARPWSAVPARRALLRSRPQVRILLGALAGPGTPASRAGSTSVAETHQLSRRGSHARARRPLYARVLQLRTRVEILFVFGIGGGVDPSAANYPDRAKRYSQRVHDRSTREGYAAGGVLAGVSAGDVAGHEDRQGAGREASGAAAQGKGVLLRPKPRRGRPEHSNPPQGVGGARAPFSPWHPGPGHRR